MLAELAPERLVEAARSCPIVWVQRLGWLLDLVDQPTLAAALVPEIEARAYTPAPLVRSVEAPRSDRWRLILNADVPEAQELGLGY